MTVNNVLKNKEQLGYQDITKYEEITMNAFPAMLSEVYDGWILRYTGGYTFRGNSVNPIYASSINVEEKIQECERRYLKQGLPSVFKMTDVAEEGLDLVLEKYGYEIQKKADIMTIQLIPEEVVGDVKKKDKVCIEANILESSNATYEAKMDYHAVEEWLDDFVVLNGTKEEPTKSIAKEVLRKIQNPIFCASIYKNEEMAACGLGVLEREKIGLFDIRVKDCYRRLGLGTEICRQIINEGKKYGANEAYLQVASVNDGAIRLYEKLGFTKAYTYWYRVKGGGQDNVIGLDLLIN
nr:GNAT family N-acetyltransferase [uncultured Anaerosporobacter sp.]